LRDGFVIAERNNFEARGQNPLVYHFDLVVFPKYGSHGRDFTAYAANSSGKNLNITGKTCNNTAFAKQSLVKANLATEITEFSEKNLKISVRSAAKPKPEN
jgi:hypothetical protein